MKVTVAAVTRADAEDWWQLRNAFWPSRTSDEHRQTIADFLADRVTEPVAVFLARTNVGSCAGLLELSIRAYAAGCAQPNPAYVEGIYVAPAYRRMGVARQLLLTAEAWARRRGCTELASDSAPDNDPSTALHAAAGFRDLGLIRCWAKRLG